VDYYRYAKQLKRGGPIVELDHDLATSESDPALTIGIWDEVRALLDQLPSDGFRQIALLKLDGYTGVTNLSGAPKLSRGTAEEAVPDIRAP
jgi:hypothetical protein